MSDVSNSKAIDEFGEPINNVEKSLRRVGIELRDNNNTFRNMQDVIAEIGDKWKTFSQADQNYIARNIAGTRQKEQFLVLMNNQVALQKALTTETESTGLATERYKIFQEGAEASQNRLTASWEGMWQKTMNSDGLIFVTNLAAKILEMADNAGGLVVSLGKLAVPALNSLQSIVDYLQKSDAFWAVVNWGKNTFSGGTKTSDSTMFGTPFGGSFGGSTDQVAKQGTFLKQQAADTEKINALEEMRLDRSKGLTTELEKQTEAIKEYTTFADDLKGIGESVSLTQDMISKSIAGTLQYSDIQKLVDADQKYLDFITVENGQIKINTEGMRQYDIAKALDALTTAKQNNATEQEIAVLQSYYDSLKNGTAYLATYQKAQEDAMKAAEKAAEEAKKAIQEQIDAAKKLLDMTISMIKQEKEAEKQRLQDQLDNYKKKKEAQNKAIHEEKDAEKKQLEDQLKGYKDLIQARKDALDAKLAEDNYQKSVQKQGNVIADLQSQIDLLALDTSEEATAKRLELEKQLADDKSTLEDDQNQHSVDGQKAALDAEEKTYEDFINNKLEEIDAYLKQVDDKMQEEIDKHDQQIQDQIKAIDDYLSNSGDLMNAAIDLITNHSAETFAKLMEWNRKYGTGIDEDVTQAWNKGQVAAMKYQQLIINLNSIKPAEVPDYAGDFMAATAAIKDATAAYKEFIDTMLNNPALGSSTTPDPNGVPNTGAPFRHTGVATGFVKGLKSNEEFATLMAGELVINADQMNKFMNRTLPQIAQSSTINNGGGLHIDNLLTINGNVDKTVLPDIKAIANNVMEQINNSMKNRGFVRPTFSTGI